MVWFVLAGMAALAALAAVWPLIRAPGRAAGDPAANETAFYKAQLQEIRRDVERGVLPQGEAESARAEAARRLIAAAESGAPPAPAPASRRSRFAAAALIAVSLPLIALPLYARLGRPAMPDEPLASRRVGPNGPGEIEAAVAAVEARLAAKPDDGKGWAVIAPVYMRLDRFSDAAHAYAEALRLLGEDPARRAAYGQALVAEAGGVVTDKAREAFDRALADAARPAGGAFLCRARRRTGWQEGRRDSGLRIAHRQFAAQCAVASNGERAPRGAQGRICAGGGRRRSPRLSAR